MGGFVDHSTCGGFPAVVYILQFMENNINQTPNNGGGMGRAVLGLFMDQIKIRFELRKLLGIQWHYLLSHFFEKIKSIQIVDIRLSLQKNFLTEEYNLGIIASSQVGKFPDG